MFTGTSGVGNGGTVSVYRLTAPVKSGEKIEANKIEIVKMSLSDVPADYVKENGTILKKAFSLCDIFCVAIITETNIIAIIIIFSIRHKLSPFGYKIIKGKTPIAGSIPTL